ncbi:DUF4214 domain-containing protein [Salinarimonas ramus]|uniref:DUF4214 domain-containing protein n=1 Tax=Salinarimonas ramus TaxID=690164 RepID=A0A917QG04_9HYPH|nr:DUF4214 domain-containing protein [Salinarimonas ramus]GGK47258.1 hypothetical protein GCM10011322_37920 [Salinarimonas ramus]
MADITIFNGVVGGTPGDDVFRTTTGLTQFRVEAGGGNDRLIADISHLAGVNWDVRFVETYTFFGSSAATFIARFGSFPKTVDFSGVETFALALITDGVMSNTVIGGPLTAAGFHSGTAAGASLQTMDFNSGVATLSRPTVGDISFGSTSLAAFHAIDGVNSSTTGNAANNTLVVANGQHSFRGGSGVDTVIVRFEAIGVQPELIEITSGQDDTITISAPRPFAVSGESVERVQFMNNQDQIVRTIAYDTAPGENAGSVYRVYQAAFDRTPDNDGLKFWIDRADGGISLVDIAAGFVGSAEFQSIYGVNPTSEQFVARLYQNVLGREGEAGGLEFWTNELRSGSRSQAQVLADFAESAENVMGVAPSIVDGIVLL